MKICDFIKMERLRQGYTLTELAKKTGFSKSTLSGLENDKFHRFDTIRSVLEALGLTVDDATRAGVEWFEEKKKPEPTDFEKIVDYISASPENEDRVRRFIAYLDKLKGRN